MSKQIRLKIQTAIVGGGASGLFLAALLQADGEKIALFERGERLGRKLAATGNGQGNITNNAVKDTPYFSSSKRGAECAQTLVRRYDERSLRAFFERLGVLLFFDERGRGYPTGRQASALTDALRFYVAEKGVQTYTNTRIVKLEKRGENFYLTDEKGEIYEAKTVVLCAGGKAAKNFGTDGSAYALAQGFGHTLTPLYPSLVQLKTDASKIKSLKGIRIFDTAITASWQAGKEAQTHTVSGDILFTDYGVSGDAVFRLSAFLADKANGTLSVDFLPNVEAETLVAVLQDKWKNFHERDWRELLGGIVNNTLGRAIMKGTNEGDIQAVVAGVKGFTLNVLGTMGFDYAQVTKGGIPLVEVDEHLQSQKVEGLYFAGEMLDVDGECGGFNLQWAYSSACAVATALQGKNTKSRG